MKISIICRNSLRRCSTKYVFLKILQNSQENTSARVFFSWIIGRRPQTCNFIKKDTSTGGSFQYFEEHFACRTDVGDCFWIYQNINCQKVSVSQLIISKSYEEVGSIGRSKLFLPTLINHQSRTLEDGLFKTCS